MQFACGSRSASVATTIIMLGALTCKFATNAGIAKAFAVRRCRRFATLTIISKSLGRASISQSHRRSTIALRLSSDDASSSTPPSAAAPPPPPPGPSNTQNTDTSAKQFEFFIDTAQDMEDLGGLLSTMSVAPTVLLLDGDLGAGKTALSRGFLRAATGDESLIVTSPTYLLSNVYTTSHHQGRVYHMDLYRLEQKTRVDEIRDLLRPLNLDDIFANDVTLLEWPERLGPAFVHRRNDTNAAPVDNTTTTTWPILPSERLEVDIRIRETKSSHHDINDVEDVQSRIVTLTPIGKQWMAALQEAVDDGYVDDFLYQESDDDDDHDD